MVDHLATLRPHATRRRPAPDGCPAHTPQRRAAGRGGVVGEAGGGVGGVSGRGEAGGGGGGWTTGGGGGWSGSGSGSGTGSSSRGFLGIGSVPRQLLILNSKLGCITQTRTRARAHTHTRVCAQASRLSCGGRGCPSRSCGTERCAPCSPWPTFPCGRACTRSPGVRPGSSPLARARRPAACTP